MPHAGAHPRLRTVSPLLAVAAVYAAALAIMASTAFARAPTVLSAAIAFDLTLTTSGLVWWLGVRRAGWPRWTIAATFAAGLFAGRTLLPGGVVVTALIAGWLAIEAALSVLAIARIRTVIRVARACPGPGPVAAVEAGLRAAGLPARLATIAATDVVAVGLGLGGWFRRAPRDAIGHAAPASGGLFVHPAPASGGRFAMHRRKSWTAIVLVLLALIAAETAALHLILVGWSVVVAWVATAMSIYAALWLAADLHALRLYPLRVTADAIEVSVGLRWRITIPRDAITAVTLADRAPDGALDASVLEPTVVVTLARPIEVRGLFGIRRRPAVIALTVDEPERPIAALAPPAPRPG